MDKSGLGDRLTINGGCFCGAINYEIQDGDYLVANCHCTMCRRISGAPFVTWLIVPKSAFRYTSGAPRLLQSSEKGRRFFCAKCGTPLTYESTTRTRDIDLTTGTLSNPERFVPTTSVYNENKLSWLGKTEFRDGCNAGDQRLYQHGSAGARHRLQSTPLAVPRTGGNDHHDLGTRYHYYRNRKQDKRKQLNHGGTPRRLTDQALALRSDS